MSNYPAGVSDSHPYFNPKETNAAVECGADEALVVPAHTVMTGLQKLRVFCGEFAKESEGNAKARLVTIDMLIGRLQKGLEVLGQEREYECPFTGDLDLEESECARWDCPVCGNERETDTIPEERDPDEAWDRRGDDD
jgi:rubrerythrin